jgi:Protein of unknown function (DUF3807)
MSLTRTTLLRFHNLHFPGQLLPAVSHPSFGFQPADCAHGPLSSVAEDNEPRFYEDGVKRTLTDEQIAIFRHTEIQQLLRERDRKVGEDSNGKTESEHDNWRGSAEMFQAEDRRPAAPAGSDVPSSREDKGKSQKENEIWSKTSGLPCT